MEAFKEWVGPAIGILAIIVSLLIYRASRIGARPVYQGKALRLIGQEPEALPSDVQILYKGRAVPRLTKHYVTFWNSGNATLRGTDITEGDPVALALDEEAEILDTRVLKMSRGSIRFSVQADQLARNRVLLHFDYLDAGDGAVVEILHTGEKRNPKVSGTIRGVPKGLMDWGVIPPFGKAQRGPLRIFRLLNGFNLVAGTALIMIGLLPKPPAFLLTTPVLMARIFSWVMGSTLLLLAFGSWRITRKRFPKALSIEDLAL